MAQPQDGSASKPTPHHVPANLRQRGYDGYPVGADALLRQACGPIPEAELFQHPSAAPQKPVELLGWDWSVTFGRWSALVIFADGWHGYTYPYLPTHYVDPELLARHSLTGTFSITEDAKPWVAAIGLNTVLSWFTEKHGSVRGGETRSIGNGLTAYFGFDADKPAGKNFYVTIGTDKAIFVIYSPNEASLQNRSGFWSNEHGWCDLESATLFNEVDQATFNLPLATGRDAAWMPLSTATRGELHS